MVTYKSNKIFAIALLACAIPMQNIHPNVPSKTATNSVSANSEWQHPYRNNKECPTEAVFAPALFQSEMTAVYYTGIYTASTDEKFESTKPFNVIHPDHIVSCNFCEIIPIHNNKTPLNPKNNLHWISKQFSSLLGLRDSVYSLIMKTTCTNPSNGISVQKHGIDFSKLNIGQEGDIEKLSNAYDTVEHNLDIIMYAFSRGSATTFNFLATDYQNKQNKRVKAAVLGGCFDSVKNLLAQKGGKLFNNQFAFNFINKHFIALNIKNRKDPIDLAAQFPHDIPLLLVASKNDEIVPYEGTLALYKKLKETGHDLVYLLTLEKALHGGHLFTNNQIDCERYLHTVHAFYKHFGLSYISDYAAKGKTIFEYECSPV